ncbi:hypothetical protein HDU76_012396 [Blyttiomyces sp. JEL0837]|nr:hypothetical protein HDU76_012396 [Blyttiomyces sp. JEL0837]
MQAPSPSTSSIPESPSTSASAPTTNDDIELGPGDFRPPPAFVQASLARQAKIKQQQSAREQQQAVIGKATNTGPSSSSEFTSSPGSKLIAPSSPPISIPRKPKTHIGGSTSLQDYFDSSFSPSSQSPSIASASSPRKFAGSISGSLTGTGKKPSSKSNRGSISAQGVSLGSSYSSSPKVAGGIPPPAAQSNYQGIMAGDDVNSSRSPESPSISVRSSVSNASPASHSHFSTPSKAVLEISRLKAAREERRALAAEMKKSEEGLDDVSKDTRLYRGLIAKFRATQVKKAKTGNSTNASSNTTDESYAQSRIRVCVRKRPLNANGRTHRFLLDNTYDETSTNQLVYSNTVAPLVQALYGGGTCTFFAYGQTGSGKTHTIFGNERETGIYEYACRDIFSLLKRVRTSTSSKSKTTAGQETQLALKVRFFEIYGPKVLDLLSPDKRRVQLLEDKSGTVQVYGLTEVSVTNLEDLLGLANVGRAARTTGSTEANPESSRSHAVFQIRLVENDEFNLNEGLIGSLNLVDLAGSERGVDVGIKSDRKSRVEGAEINKSLLALKECIRALHRREVSDGTAGGGEQHIPFRASKLTQILRDSFIGPRSKTVMVATISPSSLSAEHTLNTMRYADRVKELKSRPKGLSKVAGGGKGGVRKTKTFTTVTNTANAAISRSDVQSSEDFPDHEIDTLPAENSADEDDSGDEFNDFAGDAEIENEFDALEAALEVSEEQLSEEEELSKSIYSDIQTSDDDEPEAEESVSGSYWDQAAAGPDLFQPTTNELAAMGLEENPWEDSGRLLGLSQSQKRGVETPTRKVISGSSSQDLSIEGSYNLKMSEKTNTKIPGSTTPDTSKASLMSSITNLLYCHQANLQKQRQLSLEENSILDDFHLNHDLDSYVNRLTLVTKKKILLAQAMRAHIDEFKQQKGLIERGGSA